MGWGTTGDDGMMRPTFILFFYFIFRIFVVSTVSCIFVSFNTTLGNSVIRRIDELPDSAQWLRQPGTAIA
jgi:hypothetical protein